MIWGILDISCQQGFLYAIAVFGVVLSLRMLNWPDLTVDGSFTLGGAVAGVMLSRGFSPWLGVPAAAAAGFLAGMATVFLNRRLGISKILSGILIMLILYSINLRIMGRANISLLRIPTLFTLFDERGPGDWLRIASFFGISLLFLGILCYLVTTKMGLHIRATGDNEFMVQCQGVNTDHPYYLGLGLSNALVAISGSLVAQNQGFADINMGIGFIMIGIAGLIIGESLLAGARGLSRTVFGHKKTLNGEHIQEGIRLLPWRSYAELFAALVGAFAYFFIIAVCLRLGLAPTDLRLATGVLVILGIALRFDGPLVETYSRSKL